MDVDTYYVDLERYARESLIDREHSDIFEIDDLLNVLKDLVRREEVHLTGYLYNSKPTSQKLTKRVSLHSPASIDIYDSEGRHTGLISNPNQNSDIQLTEEQIPNSHYYEFGEGKYISLPKDGTYKVVIRGLAIGTFTLELENGVAGDYSGGPIFSDIPVSTSTVATLNLDNSTLALSLDSDGDGVFETVLKEDEAYKKTVVTKEVAKEESTPASQPEGQGSSSRADSFQGSNGPIVGTFSLGSGQVLGISIGSGVTMSRQEQIQMFRMQLISLLKQVIVLLQEEVERLRLDQGHR